MIIETNKAPEIGELFNLFSQTTWASNRSHNGISKMLTNNDLIVCIREDSKLIGFGRIISDGRYRGLLDDIVVDSAYRGKGYGSVIVEELLKLSTNIEEIFLNADHKMMEYYAKFGFKEFDGSTMKKLNNGC